MRKKMRRIGIGIPTSQRSAQPILPLALLRFKDVFMALCSGGFNDYQDDITLLVPLQGLHGVDPYFLRGECTTSVRATPRSSSFSAYSSKVSSLKSQMNLPSVQRHTISTFGLCGCLQAVPFPVLRHLRTQKAHQSQTQARHLCSISDEVLRKVYEWSGAHGDSLLLDDLNVYGRKA